MTLNPNLRRGLLALVLTLVGLAGVVLIPHATEAAPAKDLSAKVQCSDGSLSITFSWESTRTGDQWLDISIDGPSFAPGSFAGTGPLNAGREAIDWDTAMPETEYFVRINTYDGRLWAATPTLSFTTPSCGASAAPDQPSGTAPNAAMLALQTSLEQEIAARSFETAVAVTDLQTGETISVNGDRQQLTGCTINLLAIMQSDHRPRTRPL